MVTLTTDEQAPTPQDALVLANMWWHRVGFPPSKLPPYSEACRRCGGTTKLLYTGSTCPNCDGTGWRLGVPSVDHRRLTGDGQVHSVPAGPIDTYAPLAIGSRTARLGIPVGWKCRTPTELAALQTVEGDSCTVVAQLNPAEARPDVVYGVTVTGATAPAGFFTDRNLLRLVLAVEEGMGQRAVSPIDRVAFGDGVAWLWHLEGAVPGRLLSRPDLPYFPAHCAELWAQVDGRTALKILLTAPSGSAQEATDAFNTMIASWRWDG